MKVQTKIFLIFLLVLLTACSRSDHSDLRAYVDEVKRRPAGAIDPIPTFVPYEAFVYSSASLRSPFDPPVDVQRRQIVNSGKNIKPDFNREKEYLESFDLNSLTMVGSIIKRGVLWALLKDGSGGVHRVKKGNYVGKNHGEIVATAESQIEITEIVSDGLSGWVERPRVIVLSDQD